MPVFDVVPHVGIGPLRLGMTQSEVRGAVAGHAVNQQYTNVVLAAGCYVGEVMRRLTGDKYKWVNYADYFPHNPQLSHVPEQPGTAAVLVSAAGGMWMPLNKIARYIGEGPENSTHFFVAAELSPRK